MATFTPTLAQDVYPSKSIRLLVGVGPGSTVDGSARVIAERMSRLLGQSIVVENQPGAGGMLAAKNAISAKPDGYTLLYYYTDSIAIAPLLSKDPPFDATKDLAYVGDVVRIYGVLLAVPSTSAINTFDDFAKAAKSSATKLNYGTWGIGSSAHLGFEMIGEKLGFQLVHVPYKSGAASYVAALSGEVDIVMSVASTAPVRSGRLRPIAVAGSRRLSEFPAVPTLVELGIGEQAFAPVTYGIAAPTGTPAAILEKLRDAAEKVVRSPESVERLVGMGVEPALAAPTEAASNIRRATAAYSPVIKRLGISNQ